MAAWSTLWCQEIFLFPRNHPERRELFANIMKGLGYSSTFAKFKTNVKNPPVSMENVNYDIFSIVLILSKMLPELNDEQCQQLKQWLHRYIHFDYTDNGSGETLLHWTCSRPNIPVDLVRLLLEVKANHNAFNSFGQTPLHSVATNWDSRANVVEAADLLMDADVIWSNQTNMAQHLFNFFGGCMTGLLRKDFWTRHPTWKIWSTMLSSL